MAKLTIYDMLLELRERKGDTRQTMAKTPVTEWPEYDLVKDKYAKVSAAYDAMLQLYRITQEDF